MILDFDYMESLIERPLTLKEKRQAIKLQKRIDKYKREMQERLFTHPMRQDYQFTSDR